MDLRADLAPCLTTHNAPGLDVPSAAQDILAQAQRTSKPCLTKGAEATEEAYFRGYLRGYFIFISYY